MPWPARKSTVSSTRRSSAHTRSMLSPWRARAAAAAALRSLLALPHDVPQIRRGENSQCTYAGPAVGVAARMSCRTCRVALAVNAAIGLSGKFCRSELSCRYSGPKLVPPLRNAVRLVDREERQRNPPQPRDRILPRQPLRRQVQQPVGPLRRRAHDRRCSSRGSELFSIAAGIPISASCATWSCISAISGEITTTVCRAPAPAAGSTTICRRPWASPPRIAAGQQALDDPLLHRAERIVAPISLQGRVEVLHCRSTSVTGGRSPPSPARPNPKSA